MSVAWPRITGGPDDPGILYDAGIVEGSDFFKPRHRRRGRYVHYWAHVIAKGGEVDAEWLQRSSGDRDREDLVEHAEVLPYLAGARNAIHDLDITDVHEEREVSHRALRFKGHPDWDCILRSEYATVELKCGDDPSEYHWHRIQTALQTLALMDMDWVESKKVVLRKRYALYLGPAHGKRLYKLVAHNDPHDLKAAEVFARYFWEKRRYTNGRAH